MKELKQVMPKKGVCVTIENDQGENYWGLWKYNYVAFFQEEGDIYAYPADIPYASVSEPITIFDNAICLDATFEEECLVLYVRGRVIGSEETVDEAMDSVEKILRSVEPEFVLYKKVVRAAYVKEYGDKPV